MDGPISLIPKPNDPWARLEKYSVPQIFGGSIVLVTVFGVGIIALLLAPVLEAGILALTVIFMVGLILALPVIIMAKRIANCRQRHR